jgi:5-methylthioadenosine/S-adenosylhomocysteine deaminase
MPNTARHGPMTELSGRPAIVRGTVVTMDAERHVIGDGAVFFDADQIRAVGTWDEIGPAHPAVPVSGSSDDLVLPGYINGHQHLTGDRLIQSSIPDDLPPGEAIFSWVVPVHAEHSPDDDELSATLTLSEAVSNGITTVFEAGTVAHPTRVAAAADRVGCRLTLGSWGWDVDEGPYTGSVDEVLDRQRAVLGMATGPLVTSWVSLVGHDLMSDELVVAAAALAREHRVGLTFHMSPTTSDANSYLGRTGRRPLVHLADLGVLGPDVAVAHAVHIDDAEIDLVLGTGTAVISCPWAYLRLGQGVSREFRHLDLWRRGGRLALGCDAENAGDMVDGLRTAALFAGIAKDVTTDPTVFGAHDALELLTIRGAEALGIAETVGSIEIGKQADLVVHDRSRIEWIPHSPDPVLQLIWGADGRSVRDVYVAGHRIVDGGRVVGVDVAELAADAARAGDELRRRSGIEAPARWPAR